MPRARGSLPDEPARGRSSDRRSADQGQAPVSRLAALRERRGYSRNAVAKALGVSYGVIAAMETGGHAARFETAMAYARLLRISPEEMLRLLRDARRRRKEAAG